MDYQIFINQKITNKDGDIGHIVSFDNNYILVRYEVGDKKYQTLTALKKKFLLFKDNNLNQLVDDYLKKESQKEKECEEIINRNTKISIDRYRKVNEYHLKIVKKNKTMKWLFGKDFLYPPYIEFISKYKGVIKRDDRFYEPYSQYY